MGFIKKIWKDRLSEFPTRRTLTKTDGTSEMVTVARSEGMISEEGDAFSAATMNDFEDRVEAGFTELTENILKWKLCGSIVGKTTVNLPESFNELLIITYNKDKTYTYTFSVPYLFLTDDYAYIRNGMGNSEASKKDFSTIKINKTEVLFFSLYAQGTDVSGSSTMEVYYR